MAKPVVVLPAAIGLRVDDGLNAHLKVGQGPRPGIGFAESNPVGFDNKSVNVWPAVAAATDGGIAASCR